MSGKTYLNCGFARFLSTTSTSSVWALAVRALFSVRSPVQTPIAFYDKHHVREGYPMFALAVPVASAS